MLKGTFVNINLICFICLQKHLLLDANEPPGVIIECPPRPSDERTAEEEEEEAATQRAETDNASLNLELETEEGDGDLQLLTERLRGLRHLSPRGGGSKSRAQMSNSTHHHPLLLDATHSESTASHLDSCHFSDSPIAFSDDEDDDEEEESEILAAVSPLPTLTLSSEQTPFTQEEEEGLSNSVADDAGPSRHHPLAVNHSEGHNDRNDTSAESLALTLLSGPSNSNADAAQTPRVCELKWLVGDWDQTKAVRASNAK